MRKKWVLLLVGVALLVGSLITVILISDFNFTHKGLASNGTPAVEAKVNASKTQGQQSSTALTNSQFIYQLNSVFENAASKVKPSIVTIFSEKIIKMRTYQNPFSFFFGPDFFNQFGQGQQPKQKRRPQYREYHEEGMGSGITITSDGYIITNNHVVSGSDDIRVKTPAGNTYKAKIIGTDPKTDIALIKIKAKNLPIAKLGNSNNLKVGEWVLAIGNPFSQKLHQTVTKGIVSALGRSGLELSPYENYIQTDAPINPGNSGGALINLQGEVIGMNTAIVAPSGAFAGIGFAIPINMVKSVTSDLKTKGHVVRGWLGVQIQGVNEDLAKALGLKENNGVVISEVTKGSPAEKAGLKVSDVILKFNGRKITSPSNLAFMVTQLPPGTKVTLEIIRNKKEKKITLKLGQMPESQKLEKVSSKTPEIDLGMEVSNLTPDLAKQYGYEKSRGVLITALNPSGPAARKGLKTGDLIREINRKPVSNVREYHNVISKLHRGDVVLLLVQRGKDNFFVAIEIPKKK
ncbi:putative periplasmic serine endoprotease DegP-like precursor [bacterium BMS3Abin05]|nr:putative periplasmic serine endoprotease DegP-like precursor [bacterium BMS3Abin05]GBE28888.1 putative periplasmic serine endoprotease DegP-like precursor [bacterium BMS3Bbin03]